MSKIKGWKKKVTQKGNHWWQIGINKENPLHLPEHWIHVEEEVPYIKKNFKGSNWSVHASRKINPETINGHYVSFTSEKKAMAFAQNYMRSNPNG